MLNNNCFGFETTYSESRKVYSIIRYRLFIQQNDFGITLPLLPRCFALLTIPIQSGGDEFDTRSDQILLYLRKLIHNPKS